MLLAFANVTHLVCEHVEIKTVGSVAPLEVIKRRLSGKIRLKVLSVSVPHLVIGVVIMAEPRPGFFVSR